MGAFFNSKHLERKQSNPFFYLQQESHESEKFDTDCSLKQ